MEILKLIIELIEAIIWPSTVLFISIFFRKELINVINRLKWFRYKDFEGHFNEDLSIVEKQAKKLKKVPSKQIEESKSKSSLDIKSTLFDRLHGLADTTPKGAILGAWVELENSIVDFVKRIDPDFSRSSPHAIIKKLEADSSVNNDIIEMLNHVRNLRNQAVHAPDFVLSEEEAHRYIDVIQLLDYFFSKT